MGPLSNQQELELPGKKDDWLWWAVDTLASEYGWDIDRILYRVTIPELFRLIDKISLRKVRDRLSQLAIAHNPHSKEPQALIDELKSVERELMNKGKKIEAPKFDARGFEMLKQRMSQSPRFIVK